MPNSLDYTNGYNDGKAAILRDLALLKIRVNNTASADNRALFEIEEAIGEIIDKHAIKD